MSDMQTPTSSSHVPESIDPTTKAPVRAEVDGDPTPPERLPEPAVVKHSAPADGEPIEPAAPSDNEAERIPRASADGDEQEPSRPPADSESTASEESRPAVPASAAAPAQPAASGKSDTSSRPKRRWSDVEDRRLMRVLAKVIKDPTVEGRSVWKEVSERMGTQYGEGACYQRYYRVKERAYKELMRERFLSDTDIQLLRPYNTLAITFFCSYLCKLMRLEKLRTASLTTANKRKAASLEKEKALMEGHEDADDASDAGSVEGSEPPAVVPTKRSESVRMAFEASISILKEAHPQYPEHAGTEMDARLAMYGSADAGHPLSGAPHAYSYAPMVPHPVMAAQYPGGMQYTPPGTYATPGGAVPHGVPVGPPVWPQRRMSAQYMGIPGDAAGADDQKADPPAGAVGAGAPAKSSPTQYMYPQPTYPLQQGSFPPPYPQHAYPPHAAGGTEAPAAAASLPTGGSGGSGDGRDGATVYGQSRSPLYPTGNATYYAMDGPQNPYAHHAMQHPHPPHHPHHSTASATSSRRQSIDSSVGLMAMYRPTYGTTTSAESSRRPSVDMQQQMAGFMNRSGTLELPGGSHPGSRRTSFDVTAAEFPGGGAGGNPAYANEQARHYFAQHQQSLQHPPERRQSFDYTQFQK